MRDTRAPGIEIISIRVTKPRIPESIRKNFEQMEQERTNYLLECEKQNVQIQEVRSEGRKLIIQAQSELEVAEIDAEKEVQEKLAQQEMAKIENDIYFGQQSSQIEAEMFAQKKELETAKLKYTDEYLKYEATRMLSSNVKFYLGDNIPTYMGQQVG